MESDSANLGWSLRFCLSRELVCQAAGPGTTLWAQGFKNSASIGMADSAACPANMWTLMAEEHSLPAKQTMCTALAHLTSRSVIITVNEIWEKDCDGRSQNFNSFSYYSPLRSPCPNLTAAHTFLNLMWYQYATIPDPVGVKDLGHPLEANSNRGKENRWVIESKAWSREGLFNLQREGRVSIYAIAFQISSSQSAAWRPQKGPQN